LRRAVRLVALLNLGYFGVDFAVTLAICVISASPSLTTSRQIAVAISLMTSPAGPIRDRNLLPRSRGSDRTRPLVGIDIGRQDPRLKVSGCQIEVTDR
jgi:hypothetical protein